MYSPSVERNHSSQQSNDSITSTTTTLDQLDKHERIMRHVQFRTLVDLVKSLIQARRLLEKLRGQVVGNCLASHGDLSGMTPLQIITQTEEYHNHLMATMPELEGSLPVGVCAETDQTLSKNTATIRRELRACRSRAAARKAQIAHTTKYKTTDETTLDAGQQGHSKPNADLHKGVSDSVRTSISQSESSYSREGGSLSEDSITNHDMDGCRPQIFESWACAILTTWILEHLDYPYPTTSEIATLAVRIGRTEVQTEDWIQNRRKRFLSGKVATKKTNMHLLDFLTLWKAFRKMQKVVRFPEPPSFDVWQESKYEVHQLLKAKKLKKRNASIIQSVGTNDIDISGVPRSEFSETMECEPLEPLTRLQRPLQHSSHSPPEIAVDFTDMNLEWGEKKSGKLGDENKHIS